MRDSSLLLVIIDGSYDEVRKNRCIYIASIISHFMLWKSIQSRYQHLPGTNVPVVKFNEVSSILCHRVIMTLFPEVTREGEAPTDPEGEVCQEQQPGRQVVQAAR